jgi:hypothetical protein
LDFCECLACRYEFGIATCQFTLLFYCGTWHVAIELTAAVGMSLLNQ